MDPNLNKDCENCYESMKSYIEQIKEEKYNISFIVPLQAFIRHTMREANMLRRKLWNKMIALGLCISMAVGGNAAGFLTESMAYGSEFSDGEEQNQKGSEEADPSPAEEPEEIDIYICV